MRRTHIVRCMLVALLALAAVAVLAATLAWPADATITGDMPPLTGDWVINISTVVTGEAIVVEGNVTVNAPLDVRDSIIAIVSDQPDGRKVEVTSLGHLTAVGVTFARGSPAIGYGFEVRGPAELEGCVVDGTEYGVRVMTRSRVDLLDTIISGFEHTGLYLEDADSTTVRGVSVVSSDYWAPFDPTMEVRDSGTVERRLIPRTVPVLIVGGRPTIDGLEISVNGTLSIVGTFDFWSTAYTNLQLRILETLMLVDSSEMTAMSGVVVRDSRIDVQCHYYVNVNIDPTPQKHMVYNYYYMCPILIHNPGSIALSNITVKDVRIGSYSLVVSVSGGLSVNTYQVSQGTFGVLALLDETYDDTTAHSISVSMTDSSFYRASAIWMHLAATGTDKDGTWLGATLVVYNVQVRQTTAEGGVRLENAISHKGVLYLSVDVSIADCDLSENGNIAINLVLSGGGPSLTTGANVGTGGGGPLTELFLNATIEDCTFKSNSNICIQMLISGASRSSADISDTKVSGGGPMDIFENTIIRNNVFEDITTTGVSVINLAGSATPHNGTERVVVDRNTFTRINTATGNGMQAAEKESFEFTNNTLKGSSSRATAPAPSIGRNLLYITCVGGDAEEARPARTLIAWNTFEGNKYTFTSDMYKGEILFYRYAGDIEISHNTISLDASDTFVNMQEYPIYAGPTTLTFEDNEILDSPDLKSVLLLYNYDAYHRLLTVKVEDNVMKRCGSAPLLDFYDLGSTLELNDFDATIVVAGNTVEDATGQVVRAHGNLRIADNTFTRCRGFVLYLPFLNEYLPTMSGNVFQGCHDLIYMGGKAKALGGLAVVIEGLDLDCTGNAFRFNNMIANLDDVKVSNSANPAVVAENSVVMVVGGQLRVGSGRIIGTGSILRYHVLEAYVTWADATGTSTGALAQDVPVVLLDAAGRSTLTRATGEDGGLGTLNVLAWSIKSNFLTVHTPHTLLIGTPGIARSIDVDFDRDYVGTEALRVQLVDDRVPVVRLTSPAEGQVFATDGLALVGFVVEMGSGIHELHVSVGGGSPIPLVPDQNGRFALQLSDLPEGTVQLTVTALDVAGNAASTVVAVVIDTTPPAVQVLSPEPGVLTPASSVPIVVQVEAGSMVFLNGARHEYTGDTLEVEWSLSEGENTVLIKAVDAAGNEASVIVLVTRDSVPPVLDVATPEDGLLSGAARLTVSGATEQGAYAWLAVLQGGTEVLNVSLAPAQDGAFSMMVDLPEGACELWVGASDGAGNVRALRLEVTVDTTPPNVAFTSPEDGVLLATGLVRVTATADTGCQLFLNGAPVANDGSVDVVLSLGDGANVVQLRAVDAAGNERVVSIVVNVDTTPPVLTIARPLADRVKTTQRSIEVSGSVQGQFTTLTVMGVPVTATDGAFSTTVALPSEGTTMVTVMAVDEAGNAATRVIVVDAAWTAPSLTAEVRTDGAAGVSTNGTVLIEGTSGAGTLEVARSGLAGQRVLRFIVPEGGAFRVAVPLDEGQNTIVVRAVDGRGNANETSPQTVEYTPPTIRDEGEASTYGPMDAAIVLLGLGLAMLVTAVAFVLWRRRS